MTQPKRVLVTGAAGFIGRQCLSALRERQFDVHAVSRVPHEGDQGETWHQVDLFEPGAAAALMKQVQPTHLLHLAWETAPGLFWTSESNLTWLKASVGLVEAFVHSGGRRLVSAGTCAEYDWSYGWCSEGITPTVPTTLYGATKHSLHTMLAAFTRQVGLSFGWGRMFFLYGPHEHAARLVPSITQALLRGEPATCSKGHLVRDFLHVADVGRAFVAFLDSDVEGAVNIASGQGLAIGDVATKLAALTGRQDLLSFPPLLGDSAEPPMLVADVRRLTDEVGWRPQVRIDDGLSSTVEWWRHALAKAGP